MSTKTKKIFAKEFIYLIVVLCLCFVLSLCYSFLHKSNYETSKNIQNEIDKRTENLSKNQLLWYKLKDTKFGTKSFDSFQLKYLNVDKQVALYYQLKNNNLYSKSITDFRLTYFKKDLVVDNLHHLFKIHHWEIDRSRFIDCLKKGEYDILNKSYNLAVQKGYKNTVSELKELIINPNNKTLSVNELKDKYVEFDTLNKKLEKTENSIFRKKLVYLYLQKFS